MTFDEWVRFYDRDDAEPNDDTFGRADMAACWQAAQKEAAQSHARAALAAADVTPGWKPIETAPQDGYMLVHEDSAIRALLRIKGVWHKTGYPAIIEPNWGDVIVGEDAKRLLPPKYKLEVRDGCCENPTHWMPLPAAPSEPRHE